MGIKLRSIALALALVASLAAAQECTYEIEPNDTPATATIITGAGPDSAFPPGREMLATACLTGELSGSDQDAFMWEVDAQGSAQLWTVELEGIRGNLTRLDIIRVEFAENQLDVTAREDLLTVGTTTGGLVTSAPFLVEPGRYVIGVSKSGGQGEYVALLKPKEAITYRTPAPDTDSAYASEFAVQGAAPEGLEQRWEVTEDDEGWMWGVSLEAALGTAPTLVLEGPSGEVGRAKVDDVGRADLRHLGLQAGTYVLKVVGGTGVFRLRTAREGRITGGVATEPNDSFATANVFPLGTTMQGSTGGDDYFRVEVDAAAAATAWDLEIEANNNLDIRILREDGTLLLERRGTTASLRGLVLPEGAYQVRLNGRDLVYSLAWAEGTAPAAEWEVEPNDTVASATPLGEELQVRGELSDRDGDVFSFEVSGEPQLYRMQLAARGSVKLAVLDGAGRTQLSQEGSGRVRLDNVVLLSGTHHVAVTGSPGEYALKLLALGPAPNTPNELPSSADEARAADVPLVPSVTPQEAQTTAEAGEAPATAELPPLPPPPPGVLEAEPNDDTILAELLLPGVTRVGTLHGTRDADYYRFFLPEAQPVRIELVPPEGIGPIAFRLAEAGWVSHDRGAEPGTPTVTEQWLLAGDHYLEVRGVDTEGGYYQLRLTPLNAAVPFEDAELRGAAMPGAYEPDAAPAQVSVELTSDVAELAAFWDQGQTVRATARLRNDSGVQQTVSLRPVSSEPRTSVELASSLTLAPGETAEVPLVVRAPSDLRNDAPLRISLAADTGSGVSGASLALGARCEALPVSPSPYWPVPEPLLGHLDLLWAGFGAERVGEAGGRQARQNAIIDGRVTPATGGWGSVNEPVTFLLAGGQAADVSGVLIHPLTDGAVATQMRLFRVETSVDGTTFTTAYEGELSSARVEQAFVFGAPTRAKYVRVTPLQNYRGQEEGYFGELKVVAADLAPFGALDLADAAHGGSVVWSEPFVDSNRFLYRGGKSYAVDLRDLDAFTFVVGFKDARAAQVTSVSWAESNEATARRPVFQNVTVEVSLDGAAGPWEPLAEWDLERDASGRATLELPAGTWARYLRFTAPKSSLDDRYYEGPASLTVMEREADGEYLSALGEWGLASPRGVYEYLLPPIIPAVGEQGGDNDSMETATYLPSGEAVEGTVLVAEDEDWYRFVIAPGENHLRVRLSGVPTMDYDYELVDATGATVAYDASRDGESVELSLYGEPGDYYLRLWEPKRTVIFSWDTSGSMGPYRDITYGALASFAFGLDGDREAVQLLAYHDDPGPQWLLPFFSTDPERVQRTLNGYARQHASSNSEKALLMATQALKGRDGTRALLLITDAETDGYGLTTDVWRELEQVMPRIFTFEVSSGGGAMAQSLMQGWAAVNNGFYSLASGTGDLDIGYERASCILRRPKHYRVEVESSAAPLPGPGSLRVSRPAESAGPAVEVIFDASGSMGVELPSGEQRISAAKRVLTNLVSEVLPEGSQFALRAFGHVQPMTCDTRLEVPLGPLDREEALSAVRAIEPKLLSQTPLAESLALVADDLSTAGRGKTVILITDGEESCGGDPVEAVNELRRTERVDVAIVSLGLDADERASFEALAAATNASYVDVTSFEELEASVQAALHPSFDVLDEAGEVVASGRVDGDAVELEMGVYTVRVYGATVREFPAVRVPGERSVALTYAGD